MLVTLTTHACDPFSLFSAKELWLGFIRVVRRWFGKSKSILFLKMLIFVHCHQDSLLMPEVIFGSTEYRESDKMFKDGKQKFSHMKLFQSDNVMEI